MNYNFTLDFFEKRIYPPVYGNIINKYNPDVSNINTNKEKIDVEDVTLVEFIPSFIECELNKGLAIDYLEYNYFKGFMCDLANYETLQDYLKKQLGKSDLKIIRRRLNRLETCFDITYKVFEGEISEEICFSLMDNLKKLIEKRFNQRGDQHSSLKKWDFYKNSTYQMINDNKACLFVIYSGNEPIVISLDYLYDNIFESAISSYEIDYAKFGLGNTIILKKLEWCFANNYSIFNMRYGDYPYKRFWCNSVFEYRSHVIFSKKSILARVKALIIKTKNSSIYYLIKNKEKFSFIKKIKSSIFKQKQSKVKEKVVLEKNHYEEVEYSDIQKSKNSKIVDISDDKNTFLRSYVYNFQYVNSAKFNEVEVFQIGTEDENLFKIKFKDKVSCFHLQ